jgi:CHAT domain-containing protein
MRKFSTVITLMLCCSTLFTTNFSFATSIKDEINTENIKAPPRDIKDILKLLEQTKPDLAIVERAQKVIATPIPSSQDNEVLNHFYTRRAAAFEDLGNTAEALKAMEIAVNQHPSSNPRLHWSDLVTLSVLEGSIGQQSKAITLIQKAQAYQMSALPNLSGLQMTMGRLLTTYYVNSGNFESAKKSLETIDSTLIFLKRSRVYMEYGPIWEASYESARGIYFSGQGQWLESERSLRKTLHLLEAQYQKVKNSSSKIDVVGDDTRSVVVDASNNPRVYVHQISNRELNLANVLLRQRKLTDAEFYARKSITLSLSSFGSNSIEVARGLRSLAAVVNEQGRYPEAVLLSKAALTIVRAAGAAGANSTLALAQRSLGTALVADGKYVEANQVFEEMAAGMKTDPDMAKSYQFGDLDWVLAMLKTGKFNQANEMVSSMLKRQELSSDKNSPRLAMIRAFDAASLQAENKWAEADAAYKLSMPILIDQARNDAENDTSSIKQQQRMTFLLESYLASLAHTAKTDPSQVASATAQAFQIADIARGSGVQRALTASAARASIKDPQLAGLARQEQDLQRRINTLSELLTGLRSAPPDQQLPAVQGKVRSDIEVFKSQREALKKEIEKKFPDYAELVEPKPASIERTQKLLNADEVLVSWYFSENTGYVWAISKQGAQFSQLSIGRKQMAKQIAQLRKALDPGVSTIDEIPPFDVVLAYKLYQEILAPVEASLKGKKVMLVVPHAELGQLPISLLVTQVTNQPAKGGAIAFAGYKSVPWLTRDIAVAQIPSVTALTALRSLPEGNPNRKNFVGFGDPYFSSAQEKSAQKSASTQLATRGIPLKLRNVPKIAGVSSAELALLPRLPDTSIEIEEIAKVVGAQPGDIFLHKQASVKQVTSMDLSDRKVIMFSTHGLVPGELNGLTQPALAMSSPDVTGDQDDGLLTMDKVIALKLDADWVVLSACNTAAGEGAGSEAVSGLGRAFFFAGAKALLVSNWPVDSVASRTLMTDLFKNQQKAQGTSKAELLRQAMLTQIDQGGMKEGATMKYSYAHPLFWAPFVVVGD